MTITLTREEAQLILNALTYAEKEMDGEFGVTEILRTALAQPEPEPVAWMYVNLDGECEQIEYGEPFHDPSVTPLYNAPQQRNKSEPVAWQPIDTAPKFKIVLVHYKNRLGNGRTMRARYYLPETLESDESESGWADEGWYEESEAYEYLMHLEGEPTHWMPLPPAPDATPPQREWQGLTDEERTYLAWESNNGPHCVAMTEAKLKKKNT